MINMEFMDWFSDTVSSSLFYQLSVILIMAGLAGFLATMLRQPIIIAFIATGVLLGPDVLGVMGAVDDKSAISTLANLGIALLLFMVGLKLDVSLIRRLGATAMMAGTLQIIITMTLGTSICLALGLSLVPSLAIGLALSFSSTIIIVKLLSDKREIESLYGKMSLGILIVQDLVVILAMVGLNALSAGTGMEGLNIGSFVGIFIKLGLVIAFITVFILFCADPLARRLARYSELMVIFAIGMAATMAALCHAIGLSKELGGLLAGMTLASTPFRTIIVARLSSLRDFLLVFFFVGLGSQLSLGTIGSQIQDALILSVFVLIMKPVIVMAVMGVLGYRKRTSYMAGITLGQISEFSMIFAALAATTGIMSTGEANLVTLVGFITIGVSTYLMIYAPYFYNILENALEIFERKQLIKTDEFPEEKKIHGYDVFIFGIGRYGTSMAREFQNYGAKVLAIDFDPEAIKHAQKQSIATLYGDASDPELPSHLPCDEVHTVVICIPHSLTGPMILDSRRTLTKALRASGFTGHIAVISHKPEEEKEEFKTIGADIILNPYEDAAREGAERIVKIHRQETQEAGSSEDTKASKVA